MKKLLSFIFLLISFSSLSQINKDGIPFINQYTETEYGEAGQIWAITQDSRGIMYFGCNMGLKTYDGREWKNYNLPLSSIVKSLASDQNGMVYYGAEKDFGAIIPNKKGELQFISFWKELYKEKEKDFSSIWRTHITNKRVYFQSNEKIFYCNLPIKINDKYELINKVEIIEPGEFPFHLSFMVDNNFYVRQKGKGLFIQKGNKPELIPGGEQFANSLIYTMLPLDEHNILIGARYEGFYIYNTNKKLDAIKPFNIEDNKLINNSAIYSGINLPNGNIAINSLNNGIIIINRSGDIVKHLDNNSVLPDNYILSIYINERTKGSNFWFSSDNGIFNVISSSPFSEWGGKSGIRGIPENCVRFNDILYIATTEGLYYLDEKSEGSAVFKLIENQYNCWKLFVFNIPNSKDQILLMGSATGLFQIDNFKTTPIVKLNHVYELYQSNKNPENLYIGSQNNIYLLKYKNNQWSKLFNRKQLDINLEIKSINEYSKYIALGVAESGIYLIDSLNDNNINKIDSSKNLKLIGRDYILNKINNKTVISSHSGLYSISDSLYANSFEFFGKAYTNGNKGVYKVLEDNDTYWMSAFYEKDQSPEFQLIRFEKNKNLKEDSVFSKILPSQKADMIYLDGNYIWVGNNKGIFKFNKTIEKDYTQAFKTLITSVKTSNDTLIYGGNSYSFKNGMYSYEEEQNIDFIPVLKYETNTVNFNWSATFFENESETKYSYRLIGETEKWSKWEHKNEIRYTNLYEGKYTFEVKAKNIYNTESSIASYSFQVLPPWYRSIVALIAYFILLIIFIWLIVKYNTRRLQKDKERLEGIVIKRTSEIVKQKEEISVQRDNLDELNKLLAIQKDKIALQRDEVKVELKETILKSESLKKDSFKFQLKSIANQMNPHFMFNTLNAIKHFILQNDIEKSDEFLGKFSKLMRLTLNNSLNDSVILNDEIEALSLYLDLEKLRSRDKFNYTINIDSNLDVKYHRIPSMLIQPFIENSLLHGIYNNDIKGEITLELIKKGDIVHCIITDNGIGIKEAEELAKKKLKTHVSVGTSLIKQRLQLISELYKSNFYFKYSDIKDKENKSLGTKVDLEIPLVDDTDAL